LYQLMKKLARHLLIISSSALVAVPALTILAKAPSASLGQNYLVAKKVDLADSKLSKADRAAKTQAVTLSPFFATSTEGLASATTVAMNDRTNPTSVNYGSLHDESENKDSKTFGASLALGQTIGLYDHKDGTRDRSIDLEARLRYKMTTELSLSAVLAGSVDQNDSENKGVDAAVLSLSKSGFEYFSSISQQKILTLSPFVSLNTPISKLHKDQSFQGGLTSGLNLGIGEGLLPSKRLSMGFGLSLTRNFYKFETSIGGSSNAKYSSRQTMSIGYQLPAKFNLSLALNHFNSWTFQGTPGESFNHSQELEYQISAPLALAVGHTYGNPAANIYRADGQTTNFNFVNERDSYVYGNITYTY
jgi:hypothetical protein